MIDVYAAAAETFSDKQKLAKDLANAVMRWEKVPPINLFKNNTAAFTNYQPKRFRTRRARVTMCVFKCSRRLVYWIATSNLAWYRN